MVRRTLSLTATFFRALLWTAVFWIVLVQLSWLWLNKAPQSVQTWLDLISADRLKIEHIQVTPSLLMPQVRLQAIHWQGDTFTLDIDRVSFDLSWLKTLSESGIWGQSLLIERPRLVLPETASQKSQAPPSIEAIEEWLKPHRYQLWLPFRRALIKAGRIERGSWRIDVPELLLEKRLVYRAHGETSIFYRDQPLWVLSLNGLLRADWLGRLHSGWLQARTRKAAPLAHLAPLFETRWKNGEVAFDFYLTLEQGAPSALLKINLDHLKMMGRKGRINSLGATLFWRDGRDEQRFSIEQWLLNGRALKNLSPAYVVWRERTLKLSIEALSLEPFRPALAALWPQWDWNHTHATLSELKASFRLRPFQLAELSGQLQKLEWPQVGEVPGVRLTDVTLSGTHGQLDLDFGQPLQIAWNAWKQPRHTLHFPQGLHWLGTFDTGQLQPAPLLVDEAMRGTLQLELREGVMTTLARVEPKTMQRVKGYLPYGLMGKELQTWLSEGLVSGKVAPVELRAMGRIDRPSTFLEKGHLKASTRVENVALRFKPDWPALKGLDASVQFEPWTINIKADKGSLQGIQLAEADVMIGALNAADISLKLFGRAQGQAKDVQALLLESPLARKLGIETLLGKKITLEEGRIGGQVALWVPLYGLDRRVENVDVQVSLNKVAVGLWGQDRVENLNGTLHVTQQSAVSGRIKGRFQGAPFSLQVRTDVQKPALVLNAQGSANLSRYIADVQGRGNVQMGVRIPFDRNAPMQFSGVVKPAIKAHHLPAPLDEVLAQTAHLSGTIADHLAHVNVIWDKKLWSSVSLDLDGHLQQLTVILGEKPAVANALLKRDGKDMLLLLNADRVEIVPWVDWWAAQRDLLPSPSSDTRIPLPLVLAARAKDIRYHTQNFRHAVLTAASLDENRIGLDLEADKVSGSGIYLPDQNQLALSVTKLVWDAAPRPGACHPPSRPQNLRLFFVGNNIRFQTYDFDQVRFNLYADPAQVRMEGIELWARGKHLSGRGSLLWRYRENNSQLNLDLQAKPVETFLDWAGFGDSGFTGEKARVEAQLNWPGSPDCFDLKTAAGSARVRFDDGVIKQAQLGLAKVVGLLSVDSLLRNLKVTLNQLQYNGLVYDFIDARLKLKQGVAAVEDFELEAPSVHANLKGQVDYLRRRYNLKAKVSPKVAGTLTTLATIVGLANPLTAISTYLLLKNVPGLENDLVSYRYVITGPWDNPNIVNLETGKPIDLNKAGVGEKERRDSVQEFLDRP